jgi:hypothetical protein
LEGSVEYLPPCRDSPDLLVSWPVAGGTWEVNAVSSRHSWDLLHCNNGGKPSSVQPHICFDWWTVPSYTKRPSSWQGSSGSSQSFTPLTFAETWVHPFVSSFTPDYGRPVNTPLTVVRCVDARGLSILSLASPTSDFATRTNTALVLRSFESR